MAVHCRVVCASVNVCCARGVCIVGKRAAPAQNLLTYLAAQGMTTDLSFTKYHTMCDLFCNI